MSPQSSSSFTIAHNGRTNVIQTHVAVAESFDPTILPHPPHNTYTAIWDTGATASAISEKVVAECNLQPIDMVNVHTVAGEKACEVFLINVLLPNKVGFGNVRVTKATLHSCDLLIGMDIIGTGDFAITNKDGKTVCSFRTPSMDCIDFVKTHRPPIPIPHKVAGRNEPCPCSSGKKYKKCCGK